jgi:hypothetical protein
VDDRKLKIVCLAIAPWLRDRDGNEVGSPRTYRLVLEAVRSVADTDAER